MDIQLPPPKSWMTFETLMWDLFREMWNDLDTEKNGRQGQPQHGVDIWGRPNMEREYYGVQCKGKDIGLDKAVTETEFEAEVEKAKSFEPKISKFYLVTTGPHDEKLQTLARNITEKHREENLFGVEFWGWDAIERRLEVHEKVLRRQYPHFYKDQTTEIIPEKLDELKEMAEETLTAQNVTSGNIAAMRGEISAQIAEGFSSLQNISSSLALVEEYKNELEYAKKLLDQNKPKSALDYLDHFNKEKWDMITDPIVKYHLLKYLGGAHLQLDDNENASRMLIEALQYNPEDEKAQGNAALAYLLVNDFDRCQKLIDTILENNPANTRAYSLSIQSKDSSVAFEAIVDTIPKTYRSNPEVAMALGRAAHIRKLFDDAIEWLRVSIESNQEDWPEPRGLLGAVLLEKHLLKHSLTPHMFLEESERKGIEEIIDLLSQAWNRISDTEIKGTRLFWLANRSLAKSIVGDLGGAIKDIDIALAEEPDNNEFVRMRGRYALQIHDFPKAIELFNFLRTNDDKSEDAYWLALAYFEEKRFETAKTILLGFNTQLKFNTIEENAWRLLIEVHLKLDEGDEAKQLAKTGLSSNLSNPFVLATYAMVARRNGEENEAKKRIKEAMSYLNDESQIIHREPIIDELVQLKYFKEAANILSTFIKIEKDNPLLRKYLTLRYDAGEEKTVLEICKSLREKHGPIDFITELESSIYEMIGDLAEAKKVCEEYLDAFPDHIHMKLRLTVIHFRMGKLDKVDRFLEEDIDIEGLNLQMNALLVNMLFLRGNAKRAIDIMYATLLRFFNKAEAHLGYVNLFLQLADGSVDGLARDEVGPDNAICIERTTGEREWYFIGDKPHHDLEGKYLPVSHDWSEQLIGKKVGDTVLLTETPITEEETAIIEIKSKYIFLLHDVQKNFQRRFPGQGGIWAIRTQRKTEDGRLEPDFKTVFELVNHRQQIGKKIESFYEQGQITIGTFAHLTRQSEIEITMLLSGTPHLGILCARGTPQERETALKQLVAHPQLIIDVSALYTLYQLGISDIIIQKYGRFGIARSTVEMIKNLQNEKGLRSKEHGRIMKHEDGYIKYEITEDEIQKFNDFLQDLNSWIEQYCEILPSYKALEMDKNERSHLEELIGLPSLETIFLAQERGRILYSDEERLRAIAKTDFDVNGVWTQPVLLKCMENGIIDEDKYTEMVIKLIHLNYHHISIGVKTLVEAARQSNWSGQEPFMKVTQNLGAKYSNLSSATSVVAGFIDLLWQQEGIEPIQRELTISNLLDGFFSKREQKTTLQTLLGFLRLRLKTKPIALIQIQNIINTWMMTHLDTEGVVCS